MEFIHGRLQGKNPVSHSRKFQKPSRYPKQALELHKKGKRTLNGMELFIASSDQAHAAGATASLSVKPPSTHLSLKIKNPIRKKPMKNIILIGMPGAGKSTMGVILAKILGRTFIDTDLLIQEQAKRRLQEIIDTDGPDAFLELEEKTILSRHFTDAVIATGGSVVYSKKAMEHLKKDGVVVYVKVSFSTMKKRLRNITTRGIVLVGGQTLSDMYRQRIPLYEQYADITVDCSGNFEQCIRTVLDTLKDFLAA